MQIWRVVDSDSDESDSDESDGDDARQPGDSGAAAAPPPAAASQGNARIPHSCTVPGLTACRAALCRPGTTGLTKYVVIQMRSASLL